MKRDTERGSYEMLTDRLRALAERWWMAGDLGRTLRQVADAMENQQIKIHAQKDIIEKQSARIDQLVEELGTALADLRSSATCGACMHISYDPDCDCECLTCERECPCRNCRNGSKFEWRGLPKEVPEQTEEHGWKGQLLQTFMKGADE